MKVLLTEKELEEMKSWNKKAKRFYKGIVKDWLNDNWSQSVSEREAFTETLNFIKRNEKERKYKKKEKSNE